MGAARHGARAGSVAAGWLAGGLAGWLVGVLAGWFAGLLAGGPNDGFSQRNDSCDTTTAVPLGRLSCILNANIAHLSRTLRGRGALSFFRAARRPYL